MALLERISQLKSQGMKDEDIIGTLRDEGISPREIYESLSQADIKSEVSGMNNNQEMQKSIMSSQNEETSGISTPIPNQQQTQQYPNNPPQYQSYASSQIPAQQQYSPQQYPAQQTQQQYAPQQYSDNSQYQAPSQYSQEYAPTDQQYQQDYQEPYYQQGIDIETVREIAKQIIEESTNKMRTQVAEIIKLRSELKFQIQNVENRLAKLEATMENLQNAILKKVGDYGQAITDLSEEVKTTQQSFSKIINPIIDNKRGLKKQEEYNEAVDENSNENRPTPKSSKKGAGFEDYFR